MSKTTFAVLIFLVGSVNVSFAQGNGSSTAHIHSYYDTSYYNVPEFYFFPAKHIRDTLLTFRCYDKRDSLMEDVEDFSKVRYYSLFKEYIDSTHTYKDKIGAKQFLPVSVIVKRYDRLGKNKWMCIEYPGNKYTELKEDITDVTETVMVRIEKVGDMKGGYIKVYNYYRCAETKR